MTTEDSAQLPYATAKSLRVLGKIRQAPEDFKVDEVAAYSPAGHGEHLFVRMEKIGLNTQDAVRRMAQALDADANQAGWAGLKDRNAVTTQWISMFGVEPERALELSLPGIRVLAAAKHPHKIRTGHLRGNRFVIRVQSEMGAEAVTIARELFSYLEAHGSPNYYGEQRFGRDAGNLARARAWLVDGGPSPRERFARKLLPSSLQAHWFNLWLAARVERGMLGRAIVGDLMRKEDSGGMFVSADTTEANARLASWEISATGPIFGDKMRWPEAEALELERALWQSHGLRDETLTRMKNLMPGTRRAARVRPTDVHVEPAADGVELAFALPKGAYATVILRELMKTEDSQPIDPTAQ